MWQQMWSLDICGAVVLSARFTLDGSAVHHQPFSTHSDTPGNDFKVSSQSDVHVFGLWEEPGVPREAHRNAEVTTKRRSFLPCRDSADLTFVMWGHRPLMEAWCNVRIENHINRVCIWTTGVRTQKNEDIKPPPLSDDIHPTDQQLPIEDTVYSTTTFSPLTSHYCLHFCPLNKLLDVVYFNRM